MAAAAPPRLFVTWHGELHGSKSVVADLERLEYERRRFGDGGAAAGGACAARVEELSGALQWKVHGPLFGGGGKKNKRAFDDFCARVGDGVTKREADASGDVYGALRRDASAHKAGARREVELAFGTVPQRDWKGVLEAFEALRAQEAAPAPAAAAAEKVSRYRPSIAYDGTKRASGGSGGSGGPGGSGGDAEGVGAAWLVGKCEALGSSLGALDVAR